MFYQFVEISATMIENILVLSTVSNISGKKHEGIRHIIYILSLSSVMTLFISFLNSLNSFSFFTIMVCILYTVIATKLTCKGTLLLRFTAAVLAYFFIHTFDYVIGFTSSMVMENSSSIYVSFEIMLQHGTTRVVYTAINKTAQTLTFILLRPYMEKIQLLSRRLLIVLCFSVTVAYVIMSSLVQMIITDSLIVTQLAVIVSWVFIMFGMLTIIAIIIIFSQYESEKNRNNMISLINEMMEKNYRQLSSNQLVISKQMHDFTNHLKTLDRLTVSCPKAHTYIEELLGASYQHFQFCHSGNDVIDAIVNCKAAEAQEKKIAFSYAIQPIDVLRMEAADICAILSNQLDNALEACEKISSEKERFVRLELAQEHSFFFFKVENSVAENPFTDQGKLLSTKADPSGFHGLGLKSISDAVKKYQGVLESTCENNIFSSIAMIQNLD